MIASPPSISPRNGRPTFRAGRLPGAVPVLKVTLSVAVHKGTNLHFDEDFSVKFRDALSSKAEDDLEIEANQFAASLLTPGHFIRKDMTRLIADGSAPEDAIQPLSIKYKASKRAMEFRLQNLGYISPIAD